MSEKIPYFFRQNTDFLYLTGCTEPDGCLVITVTETSQPEMILFCRENDKHSEKWEGPRTTPEDAISFFGVDQGLPICELEDYLSAFLKANKSSFVW